MNVGGGKKYRLWVYAGKIMDDSRIEEFRTVGSILSIVFPK